TSSAIPRGPATSSPCAGTATSSSATSLDRPDRDCEAPGVSSDPTDPLRFHVRPTLREPVLVLALEGWNDAGEAASTAARYLAAQLAAAPLAELDAEVFFDFTVRRPQVVVEDGVARRLEWP